MLAVVAAVLFCGSTSAAQTMAPACAATDDPTTLFREGQAYYVAEEYEHAYYCYKKHWDLRPGYDVAANLGALEVSKLGKYAEGATHLAYARAHLPGSMTDDERRALSETLNRRLGEAMVHIASYRVIAFPKGADVVVDGTSVGHSPLASPIFLNPGAHELRISAAGHSAQTRTLDARAGTEQSLEILLVQSGAAAPVPNEESSSSSASPGLSPLFWAGVGIGAAGIVTGAVAGAITLSRGGDLQDRCPNAECDATDAALQSDHDTALVSAHVSTVGFAVAGVGAVLAIVGWLISDAEPTSESARWFTVQPTGFGTVVGTF